MNLKSSISRQNQAYIIIFKKHFDVDKKVRKSRSGFFYFVKSSFVPFLALELPCGFALDFFGTMDGLPW